MRRTGGRWETSPERLAIIVNALGRGLGVEGLVAPEAVSEDLVVEAQLTLLRGAQAGRTQEGAGE
jgi:hypothetical protein